MKQPHKPYAITLWTLLGLFILRVLGQILIAVGWGAFLPAWEEWFSGLISYPRLLASQVLIIFLYGKVCLEFTRGRGFFATPRRTLGSVVLSLGSVYFGVMVIRYAIRMTLYPLERWTGGSIPIFFHWVLSAFIITVGVFHRRLAPPRPRSTPVRALQGLAWTAVAIGVLAWMSYQLLPTYLAWQLDARPAEYAVRTDRAVSMTTSDGVTLKADVYHPIRAHATPAILVRIPFSKTPVNTLFSSTIARFWAERGYTVVIQGARGRYESGGRHYPLKDERRDGLETLAWLKRQPWFDGRLGMWGGSAFGYTQWSIVDGLPEKSALMIQISSTDFHGMFYPGGAFSLESALFWAVRSRGKEDQWPDPATLQRGLQGWPLVQADDRAVEDIGFFNDWASHPDRDAYWQNIDGDNRAKQLHSPTLLTAGWYDPFLPGQLADYSRIDRSVPVRLVIGPWAHAETVELPGNVRNRNYRLESLAPSIAWFDHYLRGKGTEPQSQPSVRIYVTGANVWRDEKEWPLTRAHDTNLYFGKGGKLSREEPSQEEPPDTYVYDPQNPVPSRGGAMIGPGAGVERQNDIEMRRDVLVYTTTPLATDVEVTGPVKAQLFVATSAANTDFTAKLVDVHPDGTAYNVTEGILRRAYAPNSGPTLIEIELWPTSMLFRRDHRIRVEISSSNFPRFDRNPNTGEPIATAVKTTIATQAVHHSAGAASRFVLPVVSGVLP